MRMKSIAAGGQKKILIIAEAGVNHNGNVELAKQMVRAAKASGADAVKFQTFKAQELVTEYAAKADYQVLQTNAAESQLEMLSRLELSFDDFIELKKLCVQLDIMFLSTPFDFGSIDFLAALDMPYWKIPSGEIMNVPYLIKIAKTGKPIIMSTGMSDMKEIAFSVELLKKNGAGTITLLHCNTEYPTPYADVNLRAMQTLSGAFGCEVGYSDHTMGIEVSIAAAAMGAAVIEKHFTLDRTMTGPDHKASLEPAELKQMVRCIRNVELSLGGCIKKPSASEIENKLIARKSIVAKRNIAKGELFTEENITVKRPGNGICPAKWFELLGTTAKKDFNANELIEL